MMFGSFGDDPNVVDDTSTPTVTSDPNSPSVTVSPDFMSTPAQPTIVTGPPTMSAPTMKPASTSAGSSLKIPLIIGGVALGLFALGYAFKGNRSMTARV